MQLSSLTRYGLLALAIILLSVNPKGQVQDNKRLLEYDVVDTLNVRTSTTSLKVLWLRDTLLVRISSGIEPAMDEFMEYMQDTGGGEEVEKDSKSVRIKKFMESSFQNCHSYTLEKYFRYNRYFSQNLFSKHTWLQNGMDNILKHSFRRITSFKAKPKRLLMRFIPNNVIIAFRNESGELLHTVYYKEEVFYSKNGIFAAKEYKNLKSILRKHYKDTHTLEVYKLNISTQ